MKDMYAKLGEGPPGLIELNELRQRLAEELDDERAQHQKDLAERDFTTDQTRKKYQGKLFCVQMVCDTYTLI
jgi:myosin protein heavy chain